ncbi:MAG: hypothetical protein FWH43_08020 [Endomicrobia bacterium]|nr:hypothetical protein [Endomicrobiia bacterium]
MKIKIILILFLFASVNVFAQDAAQPVADKQQLQDQKNQEKIKKKEEKNQKKEIGKQQAKDAKEKAGQEKVKKAEAEKQKIELEQRQKEKHENEVKEKAAMEKEKQKLEKQKIKEEKQYEKEKQNRKREERKYREALKEPSSSLVLDYDLKFRAASYSNIDYRNAVKAEGQSIYQQYLSVNIIGKFDDRIDMAAKLASYGYSGKQNDAFLTPYPNEDFSFFLESAYLNFRSGTGSLIPYVFTFGKQYFTAGNGLIIDPNQNGFLGASAKADINYLLSLDVFAGKADNQDFGVYGGSLKIKLEHAIEIGIYQERNDTGFAYQKGVLIASSAYKIESDIKTFYDINLTGGNKKYKYRLEAAKQTGELVRSSTDTVEYDAFAFLAEGSWTGAIFNRSSNAKILFSYANAKKENSFSPTFAKRYDGLQRIGYGTLFAANNGDSFFLLPDGYGGINTIGIDFDIAPWNFLCAGLGFYMYSASDAPAEAGGAGFAEIYGAEADLGNEIDFFVKYKYLDYFDIGFGFAVYTPPSKGFSNAEASYLYQIEVGAKF